MREKRWYPVAYIFVLMIICSSLIIGFANFASEKIKENEKIAIEKAIIEVMPELYHEKMTNSEIHKIFTEKISRPSEKSGWAYFYEKDGSIAIFAVPFSGKGFWAPIKGFIGISADRESITGISFYEQNETPGLGAEIVKHKFKNQFRGKVLADETKFIFFKRTGESISENDIEAITGATQTSSRLEKILNNSISEWKKNSNKNNVQLEQ